MAKTLTIAIFSLILGLLLGAFVVPAQISTYALESLSDTLSGTILSYEQGAFFLTTAVIENLEENKQEEAKEILRLSQQSHAKELISVYAESRSSWKAEINNTFTSYIERRKSAGLFNPATNDLDRIITEHTKNITIHFIRRKKRAAEFCR